MDTPGKILIVDDDPKSRDLLASLLLPDGHKIEQAGDGYEALRKARSFKPDVILLDIMMPDMDGFDVCKAVRVEPAIALIPIILVTALDDRDSMLQGLEAGADEFVAKPFNRLEMRTRVRSILRLNRYQHVLAERRKLEESLAGTVSLLSDLLSISDPHAFGLAHATRKHARLLAESLGETDLWPYELAGLLAQIGTLALPPGLPARARRGETLTADETLAIQRVPEASHSLLVHIPSLKEVAEMVLYQKKNYDGSGFPSTSHLRAEAIPLGARILHVAADFSALEADDSRGGHALLADMEARTGRYDPGLLHCLKQLIDTALADDTEHTVVREVKAAQLQIGWRLRQDLYLRDGTLLLTAGNLVSRAIFERVRNFSTTIGLKEPFLVEYTEKGVFAASELAPTAGR